jgi:hypothetical protein
LTRLVILVIRDCMGVDVVCRVGEKRKILLHPRIVPGDAVEPSGVCFAFKRVVVPADTYIVLNKFQGQVTRIRMILACQSPTGLSELEEGEEDENEEFHANDWLDYTEVNNVELT